MSTQFPPLGCHVSIAGGMPQAVERARALGATAMQIFLKNSNQWRGRPYDPGEAEAFCKAFDESGMAAAVAHSSYLINLASPDPRLAKMSCDAMQDELERARVLGVPGIVLHPGAHMGSGEEQGLATVAERINQLFARTPDNPVAIYLESTAGQGTTLGYRFEHLAAIVSAVENKDRIGVCLDTCHMFAAGYPFANELGVSMTLAEFDRIVGLAWLRVIHVNDSKTPAGARRDRHEHIGQGQMGEAPFAALLRDARLANIPFILETPKFDDVTEDRMNLATLRRLAGRP
ncbi:deoxyribonuclease IV [bacterium]|nr:deoxyribonuclease IV [bacterium]